MSDPTHSDDYPREVDDEAIKRSFLCLVGAMNELRKMQSDCLCWPGEWDDGEYVDGPVPLRDTINDMESAYSTLFDIASNQTDLDSTFEPGEVQVAEFMRSVEAAVEDENNE